MKFVSSLLVCFFLCEILSAQYHNEIFNDVIYQNDTLKTNFYAESVGFFKNNEYFGQIAKGYTLPCYFFDTGANIRINNLFSVTAGIFGEHFWGLNSLDKLEPVMRLNYDFSPEMKIIIGTLYGTVNHTMIEPLFSFERYLQHHNEGGVQILLDKPKYKADGWLNWEKYIKPDDPFQELFSIGLYNQYYLGALRQMPVHLHFQLLATHRGGQIDVSPLPVETLLNTATGLSFDYEPAVSFCQKIRAEQYLVTFSDLSPSKKNPYIHGRASLSKLYFDLGHTRLMLGYWYGTYFLSGRGEPLFSCVSPTRPDYKEDYRALLLNKLLYQKEFFKHCFFGTRVEFYYDVFNSNLEYSTSIYILFRYNHEVKKLFNLIKE